MEGGGAGEKILCLKQRNLTKKEEGVHLKASVSEEVVTGYRKPIAIKLRCGKTNKSVRKMTKVSVAASLVIEQIAREQNEMTCLVLYVNLGLQTASRLK